MAKGIGKQFMLETQYRFVYESDQTKGLPQPPLTQGDTDDDLLVDLPRPQDVQVPGLDLRTAIDRRRSVRAYADERLSLPELSWLLWATQGVQKVSSRPATLRTVPSAGARHPFETYLLVNRVEGLAPGLYKFRALEHKLAQRNLDAGVADRFVAASFNQEFVKTCAVTFIWVADAYRTLWRYPERGYRYLFLDAGHVCQNLYLAAAPVGCGVCAIAAFYDEEMNSLLRLDGEKQFAVYLATLGKKKER